MSKDDVLEWLWRVLQVAEHLCQSQWVNGEIGSNERTLFSQLYALPFASRWQSLNVRENERADIQVYPGNLQEIEELLPAPFAQPGSLRYGSSQRIMDWMEIRTYEHRIR